MRVAGRSCAQLESFRGRPRFFFAAADSDAGFDDAAAAFAGAAAAAVLLVPSSRSSAADAEVDAAGCAALVSLLFGGRPRFFLGGSPDASSPSPSLSPSPQRLRLRLLPHV